LQENGERGDGSRRGRLVGGLTGSACGHGQEDQGHNPAEGSQRDEAPLSVDMRSEAYEDAGTGPDHPRSKPDRCERLPDDSGREGDSEEESGIRGPVDPGVGLHEKRGTALRRCRRAMRR
jgi:hypothetical protein